MIAKRRAEGMRRFGTRGLCACAPAVQVIGCGDSGINMNHQMFSDSQVPFSVRNNAVSRRVWCNTPSNPPQRPAVCARYLRLLCTGPLRLG